MPDPIPLKPRRRKRWIECPTCGGPADPAREPFCSRRCADEDLRRWLAGEQRIPGDPVDPGPTEPDDPP